MDPSTVLSLVQTVLQVLDSPISREIQSVFGYASQLEKLRNTISTIEAVLVNVEKQQKLKLPTSISSVTLERLKEAVYEADDLFDEIATIAQRKKLSGNNKVSQEERLFFSRFNHFYYAFTKSREIKKIREELDAIAKDHRDFGSMQGQVPTFEVGNYSRETHSFVCEEDVIIGRDKDKQIVIDMLVDDTVEEVVSVVSIVGMGGLGKTTLAKHVYNDDCIQRKFQLKMWVCVSDDCSVKLLLCKILAEATNQTINREWSINQLQRQLRETLEGKNYLLVLDDIWDENPENWHEVKTSLVKGGKGSRIIVTTRSRRVADIVGGKTHQLEGLSEEDSWKLFERMTLEPGLHLLEPQFRKIGKVFVHKCCNVPLALKVIGRLLSGQGESTWRNLANSDLANLVQGTDIVLVLEISYNYLPPYLKSCFSYCAVFPEDYLIMKEELIQLWMAQGFIMPSNGQSFEDLGENYFMTLLHRCFFQDVQLDDKTGVIVSCKMHDLIHDLAKKVAGSGIKCSSSDISSSNDKTRHLFIEDRLVGTAFTKMKRLRTCLGCKSKFIGSYDWLPKMRHLRVLDLSQYEYGENTDLKRLLSKIGQLVHLRYLDLSNNKELSVLPNSITQLCNLQMLKLKGCKRLEELPSKIGQLVHLRYLDLSYNEELSVLPNSITQLCNMQTLKLEGCKSLKELPRELSKLVNLRHLDIWDCEGLRYMPTWMNKMTCLHKLTMFVLGGSNGHSCGVGDLGDLKYLVNLTDKIHIKMLEGWRYDAAQVKEGGYLINKTLLNEIIISWNVESVDGDNAEALLQGLQPHPNVKRLRLENYPGLKFASWGEGDSLTMNLSKTLPNLVELRLYECTRLKHVPLLSQLRHLKVLTLRNMKQLEYVESRDNGSTSGGDGAATATTSGGRGTSTRQAHDDDLVFFPSLERLELRILPELKGWWKATSHPDSDSDTGERGNNNDEQLQLQQQQESSSSSIVAFPRLSYLDIKNCPNLTTFPSLPNIEELSLDGSHKALRYYDSLPRDSFQHLSSLYISTDEEIERLSTMEVFRSGRLSSLRSLGFYNCRKLKSVSERGVWEHFTALETLELWSLRELEMEEKEGEDEDMPWRCLAPSLRELTLGGLPKMVGKLPKGMRHLTALRSLEIINCENLEEIPPWISCFTSLHRLQLDNCRKVKSMPEEMRHLTSLQVLELWDSSEELKERIDKETGADWPFIKHIPSIDVIRLW